nr:transposase [Rickettsia felis]
MHQNSRNGYNTKNLITKNGAVEIEVPRDRNSSFAPSLVAKRQRRLMVLMIKYYLCMLKV